MIVDDGDGNVVDDKDGARNLKQRCEGKEWGYEKHHNKDDDENCEDDCDIIVMTRMTLMTRMMTRMVTIITGSLRHCVCSRRCS